MKWFRQHIELAEVNQYSNELRKFMQLRQTLEPGDIGYEHEVAELDTQIKVMMKIYEVLVGKL